MKDQKGSGVLVLLFP